VLAVSAIELARAIAAGELRARDVVATHVEALHAANPSINAVTADRFAEALAEAEGVDTAYARGEALAPLAGVPFTVKEMISVAGMPHTLGTLARRGRVADRDATVVVRLRAAGAIPIAVTNAPEWGFWFETVNLIHGRTSSPWDPTRTAGGSSGGEAAAIAAGGAPFGLGSDIGGSIRIPAAFCGVYGHKPTPGLVPLTGHYPVYESGPDAGLPRRSPILTVGPLARRARDLMPLLRILAGPDGVDPNAAALPLGDAGSVDWSRTRVLLLERPRIRLAARPTAEVRAAVRRAAAVLESAGAHVVPLDPTIFVDAIDLWAAALRSAGGPTLMQAAGLAPPGSIPRALLRIVIGRPSHSLPLLLLGIGERLGAWRTRDLDRFLRRIDELGRRFDDLLGEHGILLMPPHPRASPRHGRALLRPFDFAYTAIFSTLRLPATVAPAGVDAKGLPLAVQIVARAGEDHRCIAAALLLEDATFDRAEPRR
jgi:fatty acid amide hydrolase 2